MRKNKRGECVCLDAVRHSKVFASRTSSSKTKVAKIGTIYRKRVCKNCNGEFITYEGRLTDLANVFYLDIKAVFRERRKRETKVDKSKRRDL